MNDIVSKACDGIALSERKDIAKELYSFFRTITPQFYKKQNEAEIRQTLASIQILTASIPIDRLAEMCRIAVREYSTRKAKDPNCFFNFDYLLSFKDEAKKKLHPVGYSVILDYDFENGITTYGDIKYLDNELNYPDKAPRYYEKD